MNGIISYVHMDTHMDTYTQPYHTEEQPNGIKGLMVMFLQTTIPHTMGIILSKPVIQGYPFITY